jgi:hypothetical protein
MPAPMDLPVTGARYGRWTVVGGVRKQSNNPKAHKQTLCSCECGARRWVVIAALRGGRSTSCGCKSKERHNRLLKRRVPLPKSFTTGEPG